MTKKVSRHTRTAFIPGNFVDGVKTIARPHKTMTHVTVRVTLNMFGRRSLNSVAHAPTRSSKKRGEVRKYALLESCVKNIDHSANPVAASIRPALRAC